MGIDKIVCVGKNYIEHAQELGEALPENPVLFLKPASTLKQASHWGEQLVLTYPLGDVAVQPECEIVLQVGRDGYKMTVEEAKNSIAAFTIGLDMTLRTRQTELKRQGHPWTTAKVFNDAAIIGPWLTANELNLELEFQLLINGTLRQRAQAKEMRMLPENLLVYISQFFPLKAQDIIFTGTPAGISSIQPNSTAEIRWGENSYHVLWQ